MDKRNEEINELAQYLRACHFHRKGAGLLAEELHEIGYRLPSTANRESKRKEIEDILEPALNRLYRRELPEGKYEEIAIKASVGMLKSNLTTQILSLIEPKPYCSQDCIGDVCIGTPDGEACEKYKNDNRYRNQTGP